MIDTAEYEVIEGYLVPVHREEDGRVWGELRELLDCWAEGRDMSEFRARMAEEIKSRRADLEASS